MNDIEIVPLTRAPRATARVPGSKSITNRAFVLAALTRPQGVTLRNVLESEDTQVMTDALRVLGLTVESEGTTARIASMISNRRADLFVGNSGTTVRFLTAMLAFAGGRYRLDGVARMRERPIQDLLDALTQLGVEARSEAGNGCPPVVIDSSGVTSGTLRVRGDVSSQFLSGLIMAAPCASGEVVIELDGPLVSVPYVTMTVEMMRQWGLRIDTEDGRYRSPGRQSATIDEYVIEPDASAASYFLAAAAITGGRITVPDLGRDSLQGDAAFAEVLGRMGAGVEYHAGGITVEGTGTLRGIDVDMNAISDTVMTLGAVACFADGPTTIRSVGHIRHKETDRLSAMATELRKVGATVEEWPDGMRITPGPLRGASIATYDDHRMAMSMALVGLRVPGVIIQNPGCVAKTYPAFFADLERLRGTPGERPA